MLILLFKHTRELHNTTDEFNVEQLASPPNAIIHDHFSWKVWIINLLFSFVLFVIVYQRDICVAKWCETHIF